MSYSFNSEHFHTEPVSFMDAHSGGAHLMLTVAVTFSGVIDEERIRASTQILARMWLMLGCHVRQATTEGMLEVLVPDSDNAILTTTFSHILKPLFATTSLPCHTQTITTQRLTRDTSLFRSSPLPTSAHAYIQETPRPGFQLHVSFLSDATVLSLNFPHVLMDASAVGSVMRALVGVMHGEEIGKCVEGDPFTSVISMTDKPVVDGLEGWTMYGPAEFACSAQAEQADLERDGPISQRTIYFPRHEIERLKDQAMREAQGPVSYLSSGDVIVAWLYKHFYGDEIYDPARTSRLLYILDARLRLPSLFPPSETYLRNAYLVSSASPLTNACVKDMSLGELARMVRLLVEDSGKQEDVEKAIRWKWDRSLEGGIQVPAKSGERVMFASNWLTFGLGDLDVRNVIRPSSGTGRVLDVYCGMPGIPRCSGVITFRDTDGGVTAQFDWAEKNWTSGMIGEYAIEKTQILDKEEKEETDNMEYGGPEAEKEGWGLYALVSWVWRFLRV